MAKPVRFTRKSRKHKIGRAHARFVMDTVDPTEFVSATTGDTLYTWIGEDATGRPLTVIAVDKPDCLLVIHVQPDYREEP